MILETEKGEACKEVGRIAAVCRIEWKGYGKQNVSWNEYRKEGGNAYRYKCH